MASDPLADGHQHLRRELVREAERMTLYISVTLLAALAALPEESVESTPRGAALIWGTAAGLALVHWLTFDVAGSLLHATRLDRMHQLACPVTMAAAVGVALVATLPLLVAPDDVAPEVTIGVLTTFLAALGFLVVRGDGGSFRRALAGGLMVLVIGGIVVAIKLLLHY